MDHAEQQAPDNQTMWRRWRNNAIRLALADHLRAHDWNVSAAARALELNRSNLHRLCRRYGLTRVDSGQAG